MHAPSLTMAGLAFAVWAVPGVSAESGPTPPSEPPPGYRSAFTDYRGFREEPARPWPEANEDMRRLRGHVGHAQGEAAPAPKPASAPDAVDPRAAQPR